MCYTSTGMGDCFSAVLVSLMALPLILVDQNPFQPCYCMTPVLNRPDSNIFSQVLVPSPLYDLGVRNGRKDSSWIFPE